MQALGERCMRPLHAFIVPSGKDTVKVTMKKTRRLWSEAKPTVNTFVGPL